MRAAVFIKRSACALLFGVDMVGLVLGGLAAGMVLFIVSVGLSVTMGLMGFANLAHGAFAMLGGYVVAICVNRLGIGFIPALAIAFISIAYVSIPMERLLYRRLYRAAELDQVLLTIGLIFSISASIILVIGPENQQIPLPKYLQGQLDLGVVQYRTYSVVLIGVGLLLAVVLTLGFDRTLIGAQIRAAVDNRKMTEALGINVSRLFTATFAVGSGLAAIGGGIGAEFLGLDPHYALKYLVYFLIVVAVGGVGRVSGVLFAALLLGFLDFVLKRYMPQGGGLFIYMLTIIFLLFRPQGAFGKSTQK